MTGMIPDNIQKETWVAQVGAAMLNDGQERSREHHQGSNQFEEQLTINIVKWELSEFVKYKESPQAFTSAKYLEQGSLFNHAFLSQVPMNTIIGHLFSFQIT